MTRYRNAAGALFMAAIPIVFVLASVYLKNPKTSVEDVRYIDFMGFVEAGRVKEVVLSDKTKISFWLYEQDTAYKTDNPRNPQLKEELLLKGISVSEGGGTSEFSQGLVSLAFFGGALYFMSRRSGMKSSMALDTKDSAAAGLSFDDVAGNEEAKESVADLVDFLKAPEKYRKYGARMPRGILFYGPPGTGKTLLAKAVAGEGGVPFYAVSGSDFVQMYVGVGAGRIRELFKKARASEKAVIFIDEIDALGKKRSAASNGGNDERDQTLNALLTEMSGFTGSEGIIVIAATNRLDTLDEALLRPGRFDRQVEIGLPDKRARQRILEYHAKNKPLSSEIDLSDTAKDTVYFSGAMLENLLNEAAIEAAKAGAEEISREFIERAYYTILAGSEKKDRGSVKTRDREITAYHEAGHALVARLAAPETTVSRISIIPSSKGAGGFCVSIPPDKMYFTKTELEGQVMTSFGGRGAEELVFGRDSITTGASNDIEKANKIIRDYVTKYGMSEKSGLLCGGDKDDECSALLSELYSKTLGLLSRNENALRRIAQELLLKETIGSNELDEILNSISPEPLRNSRGN